MAEVGNLTVFFARNQVVSKKKKKKVFTEIECDFLAEIGISTVFFAQNQVVSKKKKKKGLHRNSELFFGRNRKVEAGVGDASRNGTELIKIEADFSAKIVTFRLVGGMHPPIPP